MYHEIKKICATFSMSLSCSSYVHVCFLQVLQFPPTSHKHASMWTGYTNLLNSLVPFLGSYAIILISERKTFLSYSCFYILYCSLSCSCILRCIQTHSHTHSQLGQCLIINHLYCILYWYCIGMLKKTNKDTGRTCRTLHRE